MPFYKQILLVEDDADDQLFFTEALDEVCDVANVQIAANGRQALDKLQNKEVYPDIIFLDLHLPVMNGLEFLEAFKRVAAYSHIPVIVFCSPLHHARECYEMGAILCIKKPTFDHELRAILTELLSQDVVKNLEALKAKFYTEKNSLT
jgi:CheY-like chemotaxis protein